MKKSLSRSVIAVGLVVMLGAATPVISSAGQGGHHNVAMKVYRQELAAYKSSRQAIEQAFHAAVNQAQATFQESIATAATSVLRSAARQILQAAIIQAAATRSAALTALGSPPVKPTSAPSHS